MPLELGLGVGLQAVAYLLDRWALRCPACPASPPCACPPLSVALTCAGPASTGPITGETGPYGYGLLILGVVFGIALGAVGPSLAELVRTLWTKTGSRTPSHSKEVGVVEGRRGRSA